MAKQGSELESEADGTGLLPDVNQNDCPIGTSNRPRIRLALSHLQEDCANITDIKIDEITKQNLADALHTLQTAVSAIQETEPLARLYRPIILLLEEKREMDLETWRREMKEADERTRKHITDTSTTVDKLASIVRTAKTELKGHVKTVADGLELEMAKGICDILEHGEILHVGYKWKRKLTSMINETDVIVTGLLDGAEVIILGEAKLNMENEWEDAVIQVKNDLERWNRLIHLSSDEDKKKIDSQDRKDIKSLKIAKFKHCTVCLAMGGLKFPESLKPAISKRFGGRQWLYVHKIADAVHVNKIEGNVDSPGERIVTRVR